MTKNGKLCRVVVTLDVQGQWFNFNDDYRQLATVRHKAYVKSYVINKCERGAVQSGSMVMLKK